jgi:hypothetical protein
MILTERDAKTRWCPFSRIVVDFLGEGGTVAATANRDLPNDSDRANCLGSGCLAWRWWAQPRLRWVTGMNHPVEDDRRPYDKTYQPTEADFNRPEGPGWELSKIFFDECEDYCWLAVFERKTDPERLGYCGLAGKPTELG